MKQELLIKSLVDSWHSHVSRTDKLVDSLTDDELENEVSPGRNTGVYLLGHLTAVHDRMLPLLGLGQQLHPELDDTFITSPDKSGKEKPPVADLRRYWKEVNAELANQFSKLQPDDWFGKHTSVSEEDFAKEPHRNRINVLISRTGHLASHYGQMLFLKK